MLALHLKSYSKFFPPSHFCDGKYVDGDDRYFATNCDLGYGLSTKSDELAHLTLFLLLFLLPLLPQLSIPLLLLSPPHLSPTNCSEQHQVLKFWRLRAKLSVSIFIRQP